MKQYKTVNNLVGWITFLIAATVYCMTIEPTASFWDCPEFITTAYKLEVGHPPGAPFFMLTANLFTQFVSDPALVAKMVNYMSALMSGACILFLFWSITHLVRKLVITDETNITRGQLITVMGSGLVGALAYTFSDTFWFSAVEGEVYAYSSMFTAIVFWLILKWEDVADQPHSDRWIILIAYLTGLSIGVHLLNLLCLPAIVLVYYYKKVPGANAKGSLLALAGSMVLVAAVLYGIVPGVVKVGGWFELLFVNSLGMPFNTGVIVYVALLAAAIIWGIYESYNEKSRTRMNLSFLLTIAMLEEDEKLAATVRQQYRHFVVDEYQDVSPLQQRLLDVWLGGRDDICVVGDASQTIYSFTGATSRYLLEFPRRYRGAHTVKLTRDYRSHSQVVELANRLLAARRPPRFEPALVGAAAGADVSARPRRGRGMVRLRGRRTGGRRHCRGYPRPD